MYTPHKHKNAVKEHHDGAIELRAALLVHGEDGPKAIHVHIFDLEEVLAKIEQFTQEEGLEPIGEALGHVARLIEVAADNFDDGHKIEITAENVTGLLPEDEDEPEPPTPPAAQKKKPAKKAAKKKPGKVVKIDAANLPLPTGAATPPDLPKTA